MEDFLVRNELLRLFEERTSVELRFALDEVKWWNELVAQGLITSEQAKGHIERAKCVINTKLHALGFPEFPA